MADILSFLLGVISGMCLLIVILVMKRDLLLYFINRKIMNEADECCDGETKCEDCVKEKEETDYIE